MKDPWHSCIKLLRLAVITNQHAEEKCEEAYLEAHRARELLERSHNDLRAYIEVERGACVN